MEVAVGDRGHLIGRDAGVSKGVPDRPRPRRVSLVKLRVAEPEPSVEQQHAVRGAGPRSPSRRPADPPARPEPKVPTSSGDDPGPSVMRSMSPGARRPRRAGSRRRRNRAPERAHLKVRERGRAGDNARMGVQTASADGGEGGIRTRDGLPQTAFPVRRHSPLGDLSERQTIVGRTQDRRCHDDRSVWTRRSCATTFADMAVPGKAEPSTGASAPKVRERGRGSDNAAQGRQTMSDVAERAGFEPAVLSHTAFRERHHQPLGHLSAGEDTKPGALTGPGSYPVASGANNASASSRRMPLTTLIRRGSDGCWASWMTVPAAPSRALATA